MEWQQISADLTSADLVISPWSGSDLVIYPWSGYIKWHKHQLISAGLISLIWLFPHGMVLPFPHSVAADISWSCYSPTLPIPDSPNTGNLPIPNGRASDRQPACTSSTYVTETPTDQCRPAFHDNIVNAPHKRKTKKARSS
ncbi:hypothetical protein DPMN_161236 [Dreissena polymorpha]|uniref:Uncharacterized protein n=1 Tax=Dreissena polymorpha TaxID=45954 RepID=A0A9D4EPA7_DREPO|nr:hypothetical protein DPMN_161236 [Dreissena polymorpha]